MATGMVGNSGRARNSVAPNSPREIANEKSAAVIKGLRRRGRSICQNIALGDAPRDAAVAWREAGMVDIAGRRIRTTNGNATRLCMTGMRNGKITRDCGNCPNETTNPSPRVTADAPRGSIKRGSRIRDQILFWFKAYAENDPIKMEMAVVARANTKELMIAWMGGT